MTQNEIDGERTTLTHQCARCRQFTPLSPDEDPASANEWWVCRECRTSLLPEKGR
ncbi:MAG: hypothetical protein ACOYMR_09570 [Ilumatobacteraceae bacterium]